MNTALRFSIIIPCYRASETIAGVLDSLLGQDFSQPYEIIVVDSSPDNTPTIIKENYPQISLIQLSEKTEPGMARNLGAKAARGEVLAFIDADCIAPPNWLSQLEEGFSQGYTAVGGAISNANGQSAVSWAGYFCEFREFLPGGPPHEVKNLTLGNAAYARQAFWAMGGFPVDYFPQEDQIFHAAWVQGGGTIYLNPQLVVAHTHRTDQNAFLNHQANIGRVNAKVVCLLNLPGQRLARRRWLALITLPLLILLRFARTVKACWRVEDAIMLRRPLILCLCWLGMCFWGWGFAQVAGSQSLQITSNEELHRVHLHH